jgi:hypothetical protein
MKDAKTHQTLQQRLCQRYPFLQKERPFPDLCRIADLVWEERKLIFEIQCSPILRQEAEKRVRDYAMKGYTVIWLVIDRSFVSFPSFLVSLRSPELPHSWEELSPLPQRRKRKNLFICWARKIFYISLEKLLRAIAKK